MPQSDPILFRTRSVILTNHNLFVHGTRYDLADIEAVQASRASYFWPLFIARGALLVFAVGMALGLIQEVLAGSALLVLLMLLFLALFAGTAFYLLIDVPAYSVQIVARGERATVLHSDAEYVQIVARKIRDAEAALEANRV